jgi:hypothetical protein
MGWVGVSPTPSASTPLNDALPIVQGAGWTTWPDWTCGKSCSHRDSIPGLSTSSSVPIPPELPGPPIYVLNVVNYVYYSGRVIYYIRVYGKSIFQVQFPPFLHICDSSHCCSLHVLYRVKKGHGSYPSKVVLFLLFCCYLCCSVVI